MLKHTTGTKYEYNVKYIREKWYEWFVMEVEEGAYMPFYLPIRYNYLRGTQTAWIWYLIPIVIPMFLCKELILHLFRDTRFLLNSWSKYNK